MHKKVRDVMTREVASVNGGTPFRDVAQVLVTHGVSAVPVVDGEGHVIGVVSEADLLRKEEFREQYYREAYRPSLRTRLRRILGRRLGRPDGRVEKKARGATAAELMTSPPVTVRSYTSVVGAARLMAERGVKRLPVVDDDGRLVGIVSRHDLVKVFARPDDDIASEIRDDILEGALWADTSGVRITVSDGVAKLSGTMERRSDTRILTRMVERVNGVIDVVDSLEWTEDDGPARRDR